MDSKYIITQSGSFITSDELYHWGTKGMKWGIRRYQNKDGSLTPAGKKRYAKEMEKLEAERKVLKTKQRTAAKIAKLEKMRKENEALSEQVNGPSKKKNKKLFSKKNKETEEKKKSVKDMTDDELDSAIARARKEDEYNRLRPPVTAETKMSSAKKFLKETMSPAIAQASKNIVSGVMDKAVKDLLKDKVDPNSYDAMKKTYDKLKLELDTIDVKSKIEKRKNGKSTDNDDLSWDEKLKKQQWEANERKRAKEESDTTDNSSNASSNKQEKNNQSNSNKSSSKQDKQESKQSETKSEARANERKSEKAAKELDKLVNKAYKDSDVSYYSKAYQKKVDKMLEDMDNKAWEIYYSEYAGK